MTLLIKDNPEIMLLTINSRGLLQHWAAGNALLIFGEISAGPKEQANANANQCCHHGMFCRKVLFCLLGIWAK